MTRVVLDTNVFVAAAFRRESASAQIVRRVRDGELRLVWNDATRSETERILRKIPVVDESLLDGLYLPANRFDGETHADRFGVRGSGGSQVRRTRTRG